MLKIVDNPRAQPGRDTCPQANDLFPAQARQEAWDEITSWPGYQPTPLVELPSLAQHLGLGQIYLKEEGKRFGLKSFKALGGAYAVFRLLKALLEEKSGGPGVTSARLIKGEFASLTQKVTVTCATDGNHGRSVAWGAGSFGCGCVIFIPEAVSAFRQQAMESLGAQVVRVPGNYDQAVHEAADQAHKKGWLLVADTSTEGDEQVVRWVMQGYTVMTSEAVEQLRGKPLPTQVLVQAGVGALAATVCASLWQAWGSGRPRFITVEPLKAAGLLQSISQGRLTTVKGDLETIMGGLSCGEVSPLVWGLLQQGVDSALAFADTPVQEAMRLLAQGREGDPPVVAGESGVAGLAALLAAREDDSAWRSLGLDSNSRVLLFATEGDTDPELYKQIVGRSAQEVSAS
ncbi:MAG: diaminopropionate ammonia-lyase [Desulfarculaceae bacterium]|jgi:diaminopropionate ammonia-lyase